LEQWKHCTRQERARADPAAADAKILVIVRNQAVAGHLEVGEHERQIGQRADAILGHLDLDHRAIEAGVRSLVAADEKENRRKRRVLLELGAILLRAIREISR